MIEVQVRETCLACPPWRYESCEACHGAGYRYRWLPLEEALTLAHQQEAERVANCNGEPPQTENR